MQEILVALMLLWAIWFLVSYFQKQFSPKSTGCSKGCANCQTTSFDVEEISKKMKVNA